MTSQLANMPHCRKYKWQAGDCGMLHCSRCGMNAYRQIAHRIIRASITKKKLFFVTVYHNRKRQSLAELPLFDFAVSDEKEFRRVISKVLEALRKKMLRLGERLEYVAVIAFGKADHRIHKKIHCHILVTCLPDLKQKASKTYPDRLQCDFLDTKLKAFHLLAWVELPASKLAVARYTASNLKTVIGKPEMKNIRAFRFSQGYENV